MDKADPLANGSEHGEAEKAALGVIISGRHTSAVLESVDESLDPVAQGVDGAVDGMLHTPVTFGGDLWRAAEGANFVADGIAVIAPVSEEHLGIGVVLGHQVADAVLS